jgi:hypothetical protein
MPGRLGISSIVYANAFIDKAWVQRTSMEDYERRGFFHFLYVTASGHAESIICDYLKSVLFLAKFPIDTTKAFQMRKSIVNGVEHLLSTEFEQRAIGRLLDRTNEELERASFERIESLHKTITGDSIRDVVGEELHDRFKGLVSVRNVVAHGRLLYVNFDESHQADPSFEQHPLEHAMKNLKRSKLFPADVTAVDANDLYGLIYKDEILLHFWNASVSIGEKYRRLADKNNVLKIGFTPELRTLSIS